MASRDIEKEYDPTQWSSRFTDPKELLKNHVEFGNTGKIREIDKKRKKIIEKLLLQFPIRIDTQLTAY